MRGRGVGEGRRRMRGGEEGLMEWDVEGMRGWGGRMMERGDRMGLVGVGVGVEGNLIRMGGVRGGEGRGRMVVVELGVRGLIGGGWGLDLGGECYGAMIMMIRSGQCTLTRSGAPCCG